MPPRAQPGHVVDHRPVAGQNIVGGRPTWYRGLVVRVGGGPERSRPRPAAAVRASRLVLPELLAIRILRAASIGERSVIAAWADIAHDHRDSGRGGDRISAIRAVISPDSGKLGAAGYTPTGRVFAQPARGAEGATSPEPLRQPGPGGVRTLELRQSPRVDRGGVRHHMLAGEQPARGGSRGFRHLRHIGPAEARPGPDAGARRLLLAGRADRGGAAGRDRRSTAS